MGEEFVTVSAGGGTWTAFRRVMVRASFKEVAREFRLTLAAEGGPYVTAGVFKAGTAVTITANGSLLLTGYVDRYQPRIGEHGQAEIEVSGRSKSQDMVDSSAVHDGNEWKNKTPYEILKELDKFGVGVKLGNAQLEKVKVHRLTPGESPWRSVERMCREQGVWMTGKADGSIEMGKAGQGRNGALIEGRNIKVGEADHDWSNRHSEVIVRGQSPYGHGEDALEIEARARDASVGRYRPVIIHKDDDATKKRAQKRADMRRDSEAGNSLKATITVQGFHDDAGELWEPGNLSYVESPFLDVKQDMAIDTVEFVQDRQSGSTTAIQLVDPRALGGKGGKGGSAGSGWGTSAGSEG